MSIRVDTNPISSLPAPAAGIDQTSRPPDGAAKSGAGAVAAAQSQDQVDVSPATTKITEELGTQNSARAGRVQQLGALYASGRYTSDSAQISRSVVSSALGGTAKGGL